MTEGPTHVDLDLEREVLGAVMVHDRTRELRDLGLTGDLLYRLAHRLVWAACEAILADGGVTDVTAVWERLRASGDIGEVGPAYLFSMADGIARGPLVWHVERLKTLADARRVDASLRAVVDVLHEDAESLRDGTVDTHLDLLQGLVSRRPKAPILTPAAQWAAFVAEAQRDQTRRVRLGLSTLDDVLGGIRPGEVCGVMARPGSGKTITLCHTVATLGRAERHVLVFSLEMPAAQILGRMASMVYGERPTVMWTAAREGRRTADHWVARMPHVALCDTPGLSVADMEGLLRGCVERPELVVIDYLGLIGGDRRMSTYDRVSTQARELKDLAKRQDCAVLLLIQVSREAGGAYGERALSLGAARDSGVVEEALDYLIAVRRFDRVPTLSEEERERQRDILWFSIVKNRHGRVPHEEWPYAIDAMDLHLVPQDGLTVPHAGLSDTLSGFGARGRR